MSDGKSKYAVGKDKIKMIDWGGGGGENANGGRRLEKVNMR
jgi:hypothetical protein